MCGSRSLRQTKSGGLSPGGKVANISSRTWRGVFALASRMINTPGNPEMLISGAVAATLATVLLVAVVFGRG